MYNNSPINIFQKMLFMGNNPQQIKQVLFNQNPQLRVIENQILQSGLSPVDFIFQYAQQNNIRIEQGSMLSMMQQMRNMIPK